MIYNLEEVNFKVCQYKKKLVNFNQFRNRLNYVPGLFTFPGRPGY
jgi:hypothetical protein